MERLGSIPPRPCVFTNLDIVTVRYFGMFSPSPLPETTGPELPALSFPGLPP